jgi:hypothetical protein
MDAAHHEEHPAYPALAALLGNDACRVGVVLCVFHHTVGGDLRRMEHAAVAGEWMRVRELAHRIAWGCRFIGEDRAADALEAVGHSVPDAFVKTFWGAHGALVDVLDRAAAFTDIRDRRHLD